MNGLFPTIRDLVRSGRYLVGQHAVERLAERRFLEWQVVAGVDDAELTVERPDASPNPAVELRQLLPDGTEITAVWSLLKQSNVAKLVTVYFVE
jgi:hypothetical protein